MKKVVGFRISKEVWSAVQESGVRDIADKVESFLIQLANAALDGKSEAFKKAKQIVGGTK